MIEPARAKREALQLRAQGEAAKIIEDGNAQIEVFARMAEQYAAAGGDAQEIMVLQMLPDLVEQIVDTVKGIDIDKLTVIDNGGGGAGGGAIPGLSSQMPAAVIAITEQIENATGVNILDALVRKGGDNGESALKANSTETTARKEPARKAAPAAKPAPAVATPAAAKPAPAAARPAKPAAKPAAAPAKQAAKPAAAKPAQAAPAPPPPAAPAAPSRKSPPAPSASNQASSGSFSTEAGLGDPQLG